MSLSTLKIGAIAALSVGAVLSIFSAFIPGMETSNLENTAIQNSLLTEGNKDRWSLIPGTFNQEIYWNHYLWNVTNYWEVSHFIAVCPIFLLGPIQQLDAPI